MHVKLSSGELLKAYEAEGRFFPSVTQVLDLVSEPWRAKWLAKVGEYEAERVAESAKKLGSRVHEVAEKVASYGCKPLQCGCGGLAQMEEDMRPYHQAVTHFQETFVDEVLGIEMPLTSKDLQVGGTLDLLAILRDGSLAVIDYKTSRSITTKHGLQLAAYSLMLRLEGVPVARRLAVHLRKDDPGRYEIKEFHDHTTEAEVFLGILDAWHFFYGDKLKTAKARAA